MSPEQSYEVGPALPNAYGLPTCAFAKSRTTCRRDGVAGADDDDDDDDDIAVTLAPSGNFTTCPGTITLVFLKPFTAMKDDSETYAYEAMPLNESFFTTVSVDPLATLDVAATGVLVADAALTTALSGNLMTWPGRITLVALNPFTESKSLNLTLALLAMPDKESFFATTYVKPDVVVATEVRDDDDFDGDVFDGDVLD